MEPSTNNRKHTLRIAIIVATVLVLIVAAFHMFTSTNESKPGCWQRSLMVYNNLSNRKDLLKKIYPDLKVLDEYVKWGRYGEPYTDTIVSIAILKNAKENSRKMDYKLKKEFFSTPLMRY